MTEGDYVQVGAVLMLAFIVEARTLPMQGRKMPTVLVASLFMIHALGFIMAAYVAIVALQPGRMAEVPGYLYVSLGSLLIVGLATLGSTVTYVAFHRKEE